jgi:O-succinylbenzoic acid--CoA ligase
MMDWSSPTNHLLLNPRLSGETRERLNAAWARLVENSFSAHLGILSSGTQSTEATKIILLSKAAMLNSAAAVNKLIGSDHRDLWIKMLPDHHVGGLSIWVRSFLSGAKIIDHGARKWDPQDFVESAHRERATLCSLVPTQIFDLVARKLSAPPSIREVFVGGAPLEETLYERALGLGWPVRVTYGMTECASQVASSRSHKSRTLFPLSHVTLRVDEAGRICIRGACLSTGTIHFEGQSLQALLQLAELGGEFRSADVGRINGDGSLEVLGRLGDVIKIGGEQVSFGKLEMIFEKCKQECPFSGDLALLPVSDARLGHKIVLLSTDPSTASDLVSRYNASVMPYEAIRDIVEGAVPRSSLGKLKRAQAVALYESTRGPSS